VLTLFSSIISTALVFSVNSSYLSDFINSHVISNYGDFIIFNSNKYSLKFSSSSLLETSFSYSSIKPSLKTNGVEHLLSNFSYKNSNLTHHNNSTLLDILKHILERKSSNGNSSADGDIDRSFPVKDEKIIKFVKSCFICNFLKNDRPSKCKLEFPVFKSPLGFTVSFVGIEWNKSSSFTPELVINSISLLFSVLLLLLLYDISHDMKSNRFFFFSFFYKKNLIFKFSLLFHLLHFYYYLNFLYFIP
jgi:hypothetical protein